MTFALEILYMRIIGSSFYVPILFVCVPLVMRFYGYGQRW
jgi:hypothetical protein